MVAYLKQAGSVKKVGSIYKKISRKRSGFKAYIMCQWSNMMTCCRSTRALEWLPLWILHVEGRQGSHPVKGVQRNCVQELTLARGLLCLPPIKQLLVLGYRNGNPKTVSTRKQLEDPFAHAQAKISPL